MSTPHQQWLQWFRLIGVVSLSHSHWAVLHAPGSGLALSRRPVMASPCSRRTVFCLPLRLVETNVRQPQALFLGEHAVALATPSLSKWPMRTGPAPRGQGAGGLHLGRVFGGMGWPAVGWRPLSKCSQQMEQVDQQSVGHSPGICHKCRVCSAWLGEAAHSPCPQGFLQQVGSTWGDSGSREYCLGLPVTSFYCGKMYTLQTLAL